MNIKDIYKRSNLKWLEPNTIYLTIHGSNAYGTNTVNSDIDIRGIAIPPKSYYLGFDRFDQAIFSEPYDTTIFGLNKFVKLAMDNNPNALEIIFTDPDDHLFVSDIGQELLDIREAFLSKKCRFTLAGYAHSQLKRIFRHRAFILNPLEKPPERSEFGLPDNRKLLPDTQLLEIEAEIAKKVEEWNIDTTGMTNDVSIKFKNELTDALIDLKVNSDEMHMYAARSLGLNDNLTEVFRKERGYKIAQREWKNYQTWKRERNKARFELEKKFHYDCKHGAHLVRLFRMCTELLETGKLNIKRPDAEELLAIRNGAWSFDKLIDWAKEQDKIVDELYKTSILKKTPDFKQINEWLVSAVERSI